MMMDSMSHIAMNGKVDIVGSGVESHVYMLVDGKKKRHLVAARSCVAQISQSSQKEAPAKVP